MIAPALTSTELLTGPQRAAVLVMYLEEAAARSLLDHLSTGEIEAIGVAMADLDRVEPQVIEEVIAEFIRDLHRRAMVPRSGRDFALDVLPDLVSHDKRHRVEVQLKRRVSTGFHEDIAARPPAAVAALLADEHVQTQALVLLLMGPDNAAKVLAELNEHDRYEAALRMARIERIPTDLADEIEDGIRLALEDRGTGTWDLKGLGETARTLGRLGRGIQDPLIDRLSGADPDLTSDLRKRMVRFEDLASADGRSVQALLKNIDRNDLVLALRGADLPVRQVFLGNMSQRAAQNLKDEVELLGPTPRSEIEAAECRIVEVALVLRDEGAMRLSIGDDGDMV